MTTISLLNVDRFSPATTKALGSVLQCYGATVVALSDHGLLMITIATPLAKDFLATLCRDVLPVELQ